MVGPFVAPGPGGRTWWLLDGSFRWNAQKSEADGRYRDAWMRITGYLVPRAGFAAVRKALVGADFMERSMPNALDWQGGLLIGEYPWSPHFPELRALPEHHDPGVQDLLRRGLRPVAGQLSSIQAPWRDGSLNLTVPSPELVDATGARWDGSVSFCTADGERIFQDPGALQKGPRALLVKADAFTALCQKLDAVVLWTVLAERRIMGDHGDAEFAGMKHVSWTMWVERERIRVRRESGEHLRADRSRAPA